MLGDKRYLGFNSNSTYSLHWQLLPANVQPTSVQQSLKHWEFSRCFLLFCSPAIRSKYINCIEEVVQMQPVGDVIEQLGTNVE